MLAEQQRRGERKRQACRGGLIEFVRYFWHILEPQTPLVDGKALEAICAHLEAVTFSEITRLLINVPPGFMKSLLTDVFWPAWEWGPMSLAHHRYVTFAYAASLTLRDNGRFRDLIISREYQELWSGQFAARKIGEEKITNDKTGWKLASSVGGVGTGERGDRVILDDPHNVKEAESELVRNETVRWFRESLSNRLNNQETSAIIVIMQRVHDTDVSGTILSQEMDYEHLMIPMEYDPGRSCTTSIGWSDWREEDGELAWPERFPARVVTSMQRDIGPYAYAGQYQQAPTPRGGGIFKPEWWRSWEPADDKFPACDFILASLDSAFTEKEENDPSGFTVWGVFRHEGKPAVMLLHAWRKHLQMHGPQVKRLTGETNEAYRLRSRPSWGLCEWVADTCRRFKADKLLIEAKASGITAAQEMNRLYSHENWTTQLEQVKGDKVARANAVVPIFSQGIVFAPTRAWAEMVIDEMSLFPKGRYKDLTDSATQAIKHLRDLGLLQRSDEIQAEEDEAATYRPKGRSLAEQYFT